MRRGPGWLVLLLLLWACTQPVPPGARLLLLHPPDGTVTGPAPAMLVAAQAWGPGFHAEAFGGDVAVDRWAVLLRGLPLRVWVDGRPLRGLAGGSLHRIRLADLEPGEHAVTVSALGLRQRVVLRVTDSPAVRFVAAGAEPAVPLPVRNLVARKAADRGVRSHRLLRSGDAVLVVLEEESGWSLWRLPLAPDSAGRRLAGPPDVTVRRAAETVYPRFARCGQDAFLALFPGRTTEVYRLAPAAVRSWRWSTAEVARHATRHGLEVQPDPDALDAWCFGDHAVVLGEALRDFGGGRFAPGGYAVIIDAGTRPGMLLMPPEGGWMIVGGEGDAERAFHPGAHLGRGLGPLWLDDGRWWMLLERGALAPLDGRPPLLALPLPPDEATRTLDRPLPYLGDGIRPRWSVGSGWPPRLTVQDPAGPDASFELRAASGGG